MQDTLYLLMCPHCHRRFRAQAFADHTGTLQHMPCHGWLPMPFALWSLLPHATFCSCLPSNTIGIHVLIAGVLRVFSGRAVPFNC